MNSKISLNISFLSKFIEYLGTVPESEYQRIDTHFKQLLNRYALIQQNK